MTDDVCARLDDTVLQIFQVLEDLYAKQDQLEQVMKDGFFGISRSRYLLGVKWVSVDQILDADLAAKYKTTVDSSVTTEGATLSTIKNSGTTDKNLFELSEIMADLNIEKRDNVKEISLGTYSDKQSVLRKRYTDIDGSENKRIQATETTDKQYGFSKDNTKLDDVQVVKREGSTNALSLFGILTPQPLRSSQKCFEEAIKLSVSLADLKLKLGLLKNEYRQLLLQKESLVLDKQ